MTIKKQLLARGVEILVRHQPELGRVISRARERLPSSRAYPRGAIEFFFDVDDVYSWLLGIALHSRTQRGQALERDLVFHFVGQPRPEYDPEPALRRAHALADAEQLLELYALGASGESAPREPAPSVTHAAVGHAAVRHAAVRHSPGELTHSAQRGARAAEALAGLGDQQQRLELLVSLFDWVWGRQPEPPAELPEITSSGQQKLAVAVAAGGRRLHALGHYQGGMLAYAGQWYWGVDRLPLLLAEISGRSLEHCRAELFVERPLLTSEGERPQQLELYFSFRSPYAYLALERAADLARRHQLPLRIAPVLPMVMRGLAVPRRKQLYILFDAAREARHLGVPFGRICDPVGSGAERCIAAFVAAERQGLGLEFCLRAASGIWSQALDVAQDADLERACRAAEVDWTHVQSQIQSGAWRALAEQNRAELTALGLWGVPCLRAGALTVWGQDRLPMLERRLAAFNDEPPG